MNPLLLSVSELCIFRHFNNLTCQKKLVSKYLCKCECNNLGTVQLGFERSRRFRLPGFSYSRYIIVARLSALRAGRLYAPGRIPGTHFS
jgi:hypothetical protein